MSQAKLVAARELIEEKNYTLARSLLKTIPNNPKAIRWLAKLDEIAPTKALTEDFDYFLQSDSEAKPVHRKPVRYERKTVSIQAGLLQNLDAMVDRKIEKMEDAGWEYIDQQEKLGGITPKGRVLQFRRPKWD